MTPRTAARGAARATAVAAPLALCLVAAPAVADTPVGWEQGETPSALTVVLLLGGIPLALMALITVAVMAPPLVRGDRRQRGVASWTEPQWFGGPHSHAGALASAESVHPRQLEAGRQSNPLSREAGGASARW